VSGACFHGKPHIPSGGLLHEKNSAGDFEGPLSLILMLLSKNRIEIRDIQIAG
jgi:hypothetical protein